MQAHSAYLSQGYYKSQVHEIIALPNQENWREIETHDDASLTRF